MKEYIAAGFTLVVCVSLIFLSVDKLTSGTVVTDADKLASFVLSFIGSLATVAVTYIVYQEIKEIE